MADAVQRSILVNVPPEKLYAVIVDYERYPDFLDNIKSARVVRRQVYEVEVDFEASLLGKSIPYTLHFDEEPPKGIRWRLVKSSFMKENNGAWALRPEGEGRTHATYSLEVKVSLFIPKSISTALAGAELPKVLESFKRRAESQP
jgi:ribosome-associated toxin RatA of RatAB toxin-antitoxin module